MSHKNFSPLEKMKPITETEIEEMFAHQSGNGRPLTPFGKALRDVKLGEGFTIDCTFSHKEDKRGTPRCSGTQKAHTMLRHYDSNMRIRTRCVNGTFYLYRIV